MPSDQRPQSQWLKSFIVFSVLACVFVVALAGFVVFLSRSVLSRLDPDDSARIARTDVSPDVRLPAETTGWDNVIANLLSAFDQVDVVALAETQGKKVDSDLRLRLIRDPDFPFRAHFIVVEFGNALYQRTLDRYIFGEDVSLREIQQVWQDTTQVTGNDSPVYAEFYAAVREVNQKLPPARRLRVIAGDPPIDWTRMHTKEDIEPFLLRRGFPVSMDRVAVPRGEKALVIYDAGHLKRPAFPLAAAAGQSTVEQHPEAPMPLIVPPIFKALQVSSPSRVFVVRTFTGANPFEAMPQLQGRPELIPLTGVHSARSAVLGEDADACVYFGDTPGADAIVRPDPRIYRDTPYGAEIERRKKARDTTR